MKVPANPTVLITLKHIGAKFDDRLRKVCESIEKGGGQVSIFSNERDNVAGYGQAYHRFKLSTCRLLTCLMIKGDGPASRALVSLEFSLRIFWYCLRKRPDWVMITDPLLFVAVPLLSLLKAVGVIKGIAWDQRELPPSYIANNKIFIRLFRYCCQWTDSIISVNKERGETLSDLYNVPESKLFYAPNYNDKSFALRPPRPLPASVSEWLEESPYVLLQSSMVRGRHFINTLRALNKLGKYKAIIVGRKEPWLHDEANEELQEYYQQHCLHLGYVDTSELSMYYDNAAFGLIFYQSNTENNRLCDPNRLYQAIARGLPVVVGNNPPMSRIVTELECGTICQTDGEDWQDIYQAVILLDDKIEKFKRQAQTHRFMLDWENIEGQVIQSVELNP